MHRTMITVPSALLLVAALLAACTSSGPSTPGQPLGAEDARSTFATLWDAYERDLIEGDPAVLAGWFTRHAELMEPGLETFRGRDRIRQYLERTLRAFRVTEVEIVPREVTAHGRMAYDFGTAEETVAARTAEGGTSSWRVRYAAVWLRESDGRWRIHRLLLSPLEGPSN